MSDAPTESLDGSLQERVAAALDRVIRALGDGESGTALTGLERELFEVLVAGDDIVDTMDLDLLAGSVDAVSLRDRIDVERLADALRERDPDLALDLSDLEESVDTDELLASVDLLEFAKRKRRLDAELADVVDLKGLSEVGGDSQAAADVDEFLSSLGRAAKQAALRQAARKQARAAQDALVDGHAAIEAQYEANRRRFADASEQRPRRNPTAVSLVSPGPLPDGASTRRSTVPSRVRHSKTDAVPRVYSRRWRRTRPR